MEDFIKSIASFMNDLVGPVGAIIVCVIGVIGYFYFQNKKTNKVVQKTNESVNNFNSDLKVLADTVKDLQNHNNELLLGLSDKIINGIVDANNHQQVLKKEEHDQDYKIRLENSFLIKEILNKILLLSNSDLVVLTELHNGGYNINGLPFAGYNITEQTNSTHSSQLTCQLENRPMSEYGLIYHKVIQDPDNCFWCNVNEVPDDIDNSISIKMGLINKSSLICIGLFNKYNNIFGFINIFYTSKHLTQDFIDSLDLYKYIYEVSNKISK